MLTQLIITDYHVSQYLTCCENPKFNITNHFMTSQTLLLVAGTLLIAGALFYLNYQPNGNIDHTFTADFSNFIKEKYSTYKFDRPDITWSCYGGYETRPTAAPARYPIIFIHGNSDIGVGNGGSVGWQTGFTTLINYLQDNGGYKKEDLYVTTWGPANPNLASQNSHKEEFVMFVRKFIEAVIEYTKAEKVYVIGHSMGVTLARGAIIGGDSKDPGLITPTTYHIGDPLTSKVESFFALAGANLGLVDCTFATGLPTCSKVNGFSPSSDYLTRLSNSQNQHKEGGKVYSFWSPNDDIIKYSCMVNGKNTCVVPGSDQSFEYKGYTHFNVRDNVGPDLIKLLTK